MAEMQLKESQNKMEHHYDLTSIYLPHVFIKGGLRLLSDEDLNTLTEDLKLYIAEKVKQMPPQEANFHYGIPFVTYYDKEPPTYGPKWENPDGIKLHDLGYSFAQELFQMAFQRLEQGDEEYFRKYHFVTCIRPCKSAQECSETRKLVLERNRLEGAMGNMDNNQVPVIAVAEEDLWEENIVEINDPDAME